MTFKNKKRRKKYPHLKIQEIAHKHPRAVEHITKIKTEKGTLIQKITMQTEPNTWAIPNEPSNNIERIITPAFTIKRYKGQPHALVSDKDGRWLGRLEKHDLKNLFFQIGAMLGRIKNEKR